MTRRTPLALLLALAVACHGCPPPQPFPTADAGPAVTPTAWTDTATTVLRTLRWVLPAMTLVLPAVIPDAPTAVTVRRALDTAAATLPGLDAALARYAASRAAGDRCATRAALLLTLESLLAVTDALGAQHVALAREAEGPLGALGGLVDELAPACRGDDAGAPGAAHATIARRLGARPPVLRPYPPLTPPVGS